MYCHIANNTSMQEALNASKVDAVGVSSSCEGMHEERLAGQVMFFGILAGCSWNMKLDLH